MLESVSQRKSNKQYCSQCYLIHRKPHVVGLLVPMVVLAVSIDISSTCILFPEI